MVSNLDDWSVRAARLSGVRATLRHRSGWQSPRPGSVVFSVRGDLAAAQCLGRVVHAGDEPSEVDFRVASFHDLGEAFRVGDTEPAPPPAPLLAAVYFRHIEINNARSHE
jgi:hypothetical protein